MYKCKKCDRSFPTKQALGGHGRTHSVRKPVKKRKRKQHHKCRFCKKEFATGPKLGGHTVWCKKNPKCAGSKVQARKKSTGRKHSEATKKKMSKLVNERVKKGTWHLSFSHCRIHKYKGEDLHGTWELRYAKYLDANNVKWRRPKEKFAYEFEGRTRYYIPDFYLSETSTYIEIKGYETPKDQAKWKHFPKDLNFTVLKGKDLVSMGILDKSDVRGT